MKAYLLYRLKTTPHRELLTLSIIYAIFKENLHKTEMYKNDKSIIRLRFVQSNMGFLFSFLPERLSSFLLQLLLHRLLE